MDHSSSHLPVATQHLYLTICLYVSICVLFITASPSFPADFVANRRIKSPSEELDPFLAASRQQREQQSPKNKEQSQHEGTHHSRQRQHLHQRLYSRHPSLLHHRPIPLFTPTSETAGKIVSADSRTHSLQQGHRAHHSHNQQQQREYPLDSRFTHSSKQLSTCSVVSTAAAGTTTNRTLSTPLIRPRPNRFHPQSVSIHPAPFILSNSPQHPSHTTQSIMDSEIARNNTISSSQRRDSPSMMMARPSSNEHNGNIAAASTAPATPAPANYYQSSTRGGPSGPGTRNSVTSSPVASAAGTSARAKRDSNRCRLEEWVTPTTLLAHLRLLRCFQSLVIVDDEDLDFLYLIRSEERYLMYLDMLQQHQPAPAQVPLPPIDVALMWIVHMLAPFRYHEDLLRNYSPHMQDYTFPLLRYVEAIDIEAPSTDDVAFGTAKGLWRETYPTEPFDLDKHDTSRMFEIQCLWCGSLNIMDSPTFIKFRIDGMSIDCAGCGSTCSLETLSSKRLWEGVEAYRNDSSQLLAGSLLSLWSGTPDPLTAQREHHHLFYHPRIQFALDQATVSMHCTWPKVIRAFQDLGPDQYYGIRPTTLARVMSSYMGLIEDRLSMDLVAGALRQRDFQKAMMETGGQSWCQPQVLERNQQRYKKFLLLTRAEGKHGLRQGLVPTLDIDLAWHTHMLNPVHYRQFQLAHYGRVLNHDDTVQATSAVTRQDFVRTAQLWQDLYQERYSFQPIKKLKKLKVKLKKTNGAGRKGDDYLSDDGGVSDDTASITGGRNGQRRRRRHAIATDGPKWCAGVVFPPFGIYLLLKAAHKGWKRHQRERHERRRRSKEEKQARQRETVEKQQQQQQNEKRVNGARIPAMTSGAGVGSSHGSSPNLPESKEQVNSAPSSPPRPQHAHGQHGGSTGGASTMSKKKLEPNLGLDGRLTNWNGDVAGPHGQASCSSGACIMSPWNELQDIVPYVDQAHSKELRSQRSHL